MGGDISAMIDTAPVALASKPEEAFQPWLCLFDDNVNHNREMIRPARLNDECKRLIQSPCPEMVKAGVRIPTFPRAGYPLCMFDAVKGPSKPGLL